MANPYRPPALVADALGPIQSLFTHPKTQVIGDKFIGAKFICRFPDGQLYFDSGLEVDTDGSIFAAQDRTGAKGRGGDSPTSIKDANGGNLDAAQVNYFVLPRGGFDAKYNIKDGDFGVVLFESKKVYACYGDRGPNNKLGEGSLSLHSDLGHERVAGGRFTNNGIDSGVVTIVFPRSGNGHGRSNGESAVNGKPLLENLKGTAFEYEMELLSRFKSRTFSSRILTNADALETALSNWMQEVVDHTPPAPGTEGDGEDLVNHSDGREILPYAPVSMASGKNLDGALQTVYADFKLGWTTAGRWYVQKVVFHLGPREQVEAERARIRAQY
jgi:hypothetical protein